MKSNARKYTVRLHPGDSEQALCIRELDKVLELIKKGEIKKGALSQVIAKALYKHFTSTVDATPNRVLTPRVRLTAAKEVSAGRQTSSDANCRGEEPVPKAVESVADDATGIRRSLLNLMM